MNAKQVYFIGIKGVAMTSLAIFLYEKGYIVSGSDVSDSFATDFELQKRNIEIKKGFDPKNISQKYDLVIVTGAHGGMTNIEAVTARQKGLKVLMHGKALGMFFNEKKGISVAGCHGKTTTSGMIASLLTHAHLDPSYAIGTAIVSDLKASGHFGGGEYFVAEADEYMTCPQTDRTPRFLWQNPSILVITNIEFDHPDAYKTLDDVKKAYITFTKNITKTGILVVCIDDENIRSILSHIKGKVITYGYSKDADYQITEFFLENQKSTMKISYQGDDLGVLQVCVPGKHNLLNALAAYIVAKEIKIPQEIINKSIPLYVGSKRRFEKIGEINSIFLYDDYAHHPTEISATIEAITQWFLHRKLIIIFQPHTFSRTKALLKDFAKSFQSADAVLIVDIYPSARESFDSTISSRDIVKEAQKIKKNVFYTPNKNSVMEWLKFNISGEEVIVTMGAGDIFLWHSDLLTLLKSVGKNTKK